MYAKCVFPCILTRLLLKVQELSEQVEELKKQVNK